MSKEKDHTVLFVMSGIIGVLITITLLIVVSAYNNNRNIERDKYYAQHCSVVKTQESPNAVSYTTTYDCGGSK
jgi:hypothetical protein